MVRRMYHSRPGVEERKSIRVVPFATHKENTPLRCRALPVMRRAISAAQIPFCAAFRHEMRRRYACLRAVDESRTLRRPEAERASSLILDKPSNFAGPRGPPHLRSPSMHSCCAARRSR